MSDFEPGDVVYSGTDGVLGLVVKMRDGRPGVIWEDMPSAPAAAVAAMASLDLRKLIVLDPRSAYDADLLVSVASRVLSDRWSTPRTPDDVSQMARVLRVLAGEEDFVAEPLGFSAAVVDDGGVRWSRAFSGPRPSHPWVSPVGARAAWSDLRVSTPEQIKFEGVAPG